MIEKERIGGGTDFFPTINTIKNLISNEMKKPTNQNKSFEIIFFTDGVGSWSKEALEDLKAFLKNLENQYQMQATIYCIGFSSYHDAVLLNELARSGTQLGNFVFVKNAQEVNEAVQTS